MPNVETRRWKLHEVQTKILDSLPQLEAYQGASQRPVHEYGHNWNGCSWEESLNYLTHGWKAGVAKLDVHPKPGLHESLRPKPQWDVAGSEVDMGAYLSGVPECMTEMVRQKRPSQVVRIGVDKAISSGIAASRIEAMGRNILMMVESLRLAGIPAEVWVCQAVYGSGKTYDFGVCVQEPGRPVDVSVLAYWIGHPGALRRTIFAMEELEPAGIRREFGFTESGGYGMPKHNHAKDEFDEWAPSPANHDSVIEQWVQDVLARRCR